MSETPKKYLDSTGVRHLWDKINARYSAKLDNVTATDSSITVTNLSELKVNISEAQNNAIQLNNDGLFAPTQDTFTVVKESNSGDYAAVYTIYKQANGTGQSVPVGVPINIPKSIVVESGTVEVKSASGVWGQPGTYIHLVIAGSSDDLYINVGDLIEYVTSGSQQGDMVVLNIDNNHQITASITDGSITKAKLASSVQASLDRADSAIVSVIEGTENGTIKANNIAVRVHGLDTAAYQPASAFDAAGAAEGVRGTSSDTSANATVYGVKQYASDVYSSIQALSNTDIDNAIAAANAEP